MWMARLRVGGSWQVSTVGHRTRSGPLFPHLPPHSHAALLPRGALTQDQAGGVEGAGRWASRAPQPRTAQRASLSLAERQPT